jgi:hypothetical protein
LQSNIAVTDHALAIRSGYRKLLSKQEKICDAASQGSIFGAAGRKTEPLVNVTKT